MSDLDLPVRILGRAPAAVTAEVVRELTEADLALLESTPRGVAAPQVKRLSQSHHQLARILASGAKPALASAITGYSSSRISILQSDPSMQELIAHYGENRDEAFTNFYEIASALGTDMLLLVRDRLEENPDEISTGMAHDFIKLLADRTGNGPQTKSTNLHVNVNYAERIAAGRARVAGGASPRLLPPDQSESET